jgi:hypothetical protein
LLSNALLVAAIAAGCAGYSGAGLVPGVATEAEVEKAMGPSADRRQRGGETIRYYPRLPAGREMYAARFGPDGKLIAIEQRLAREYVDQLVLRESTEEDVRDLLGPPYRTMAFPRQKRHVWLYPAHEGATRFTLNVEFNDDGRLLDVQWFDEVDPD